MILEIMSCATMGGVLAYTYLDKQGVSEGSKIQRIAAASGLKIIENGRTQTLHLLRKKRHDWGTEYVYRIPLGMSFAEIQRRKDVIEDGLNHKRGLSDITFDDIRALRLNRDILAQIRKLLSGEKHRKEVVMEYDGTLHLRVYREPMPDLVPFDDAILDACRRGWTVCVGRSRDGLLLHDFDTIPHMVVAGTTRYGKSVFLKSIITTLIHTHPEHVRFSLIDLKGGLAFNRFRNARQVSGVANDPEESLDILRTIRDEMKSRQAEFLARRVEDVKESRIKERHFVIIDEAAELASAGEPDRESKQKKAECESILSEIARIGGGLGYRLVFCTQYPTGDTLPRQIKQNCDARLCFRLQTEVASMVALDEPGAEALPYIRGRAIYRTDRKQIVQTPFIENRFVDEVIRPHITIKARKEESHAHDPRDQDPARGKHTLIVE